MNAKLSIVVPVFNEAAHLVRLVERLMKSSCPIEREWLFVDDGSTDRSLAVLKELAATHGFKVLDLGEHRGKGAAVVHGFREATGDYLMVQDADFEYDPEDIPALLQPLLDDQADVVYGSRFKKNSPQVHRTFHYFANRFLTLLNNLFTGLYLTDAHTCYRILRADLVRAMNLSSTGFEIESELNAYVAKVKARVYELPISYAPRTRSQGKKITWRDGLKVLFYIIRFNGFTSLGKAFREVPPRYSTSTHAEQPRS